MGRSKRGVANTGHGQSRAQTGVGGHGPIVTPYDGGMVFENRAAYDASRAKHIDIYVGDETYASFGGNWGRSKGGIQEIHWRSTGEVVTTKDDGSYEVLGFVGQRENAEKALEGYDKLRAVAGRRPVSWAEQRIEKTATRATRKALAEDVDPMQAEYDAHMQEMIASSNESFNLMPTLEHYKSGIRRASINDKGEVEFEVADGVELPKAEADELRAQAASFLSAMNSAAREEEIEREAAAAERDYLQDKADGVYDREPFASSATVMSGENAELEAMAANFLGSEFDLKDEGAVPDNGLDYSGLEDEYDGKNWEELYAEHGQPLTGDEDERDQTTRLADDGPYRLTEEESKEEVRAVNTEARQRVIDEHKAAVASVKEKPIQAKSEKAPAPKTLKEFVAQAGGAQAHEQRLKNDPAYKAEYDLVLKELLSSRTPNL
jgi:hypothetical protein